MIPYVEGWSWAEEGASIVSSPLDRPGAGFVRDQERLRPLRAVVDLVRAQLETEPGFVVDGSPPRRR